MHIVITGAAGFLGQRLVERLVRTGELAGQALSRLTLIDQVEPTRPVVSGVIVRSQALDISQPGVLDEVLAERPDVIYHLAAVVSSAAEADLDLGMRVKFRRHPCPARRLPAAWARRDTADHGQLRGCLRRRAARYPR